MQYIYLCRLTWHSRGYSATQGSHSCHGDLLSSVLFGAGVSSSHHVGLEQCAFQINMVVRQSLVYSCQHLQQQKEQNIRFRYETEKHTLISIPSEMKLNKLDKNSYSNINKKEM